MIYGPLKYTKSFVTLPNPHTVENVINARISHVILVVSFVADLQTVPSFFLIFKQSGQTSFVKTILFD